MSAAAGHDIRKLIAMIKERRPDIADRIINPGNAMYTESPTARFQMGNLPRRPGDRRR
jgi:hypothetical protein